MATFGPFNPYIIDKLPEIILMIVPGIKKGETFLCPPSSKTSLVDSIRSIPPIPEPMDTPILSDVFSSITKPESFIASIPAANPYCIKVSMRRASFALRYCSGSKFFTSPAIWDEKLDVSNFEIAVIPDFPAIIFFQVSDTPIPTGVIRPKPVITTLLLLIL